MTSTGIPRRFLDTCVDLAQHNKAPTISSFQVLISDRGVIVDSTDVASSPYSVSKAEAKFYYAGLPSNPVLVYRTSTTPWKRPTGPEAYRELKEVKPVFSHKIVTVWADLGPKVCTCLDSLRVTWTSVDVVRFAVVEKAPGPPVLWIGVVPQSLSGEGAHVAAARCMRLLNSYRITDVEVEFRESVFTRFAGLKLLKSVPSTDATAGVRGPLTPVLGLRIAARATPYIEGTGALYISEGRNSDKVYILTARHVLFPPNAGDNSLYNFVHVSQRRREVILLGLRAFQTVLKSTMVKIGEHQIMVDYYKQQLNDMEGDDAEEQVTLEGNLTKEEKAIRALNQFHDETTKYWSEESQRVLGHIAYSPPLTFGTGAEKYTEDWALIELDRNKIDWDTFKGNVIDLGTDIPVYDFTLRMYPNPTARTSFRYPSNRLLPIQGVIKQGELRRPEMLDQDGESCLIVTKNGCTTGLTIGRATGVESFVRTYFPDGRQETSMEWAILPYSHKSGAFSAPGDSGAIIVDGKGRIGGLLTGGAGQTESTDVTYATPFYWLLQRIKARFPHACLYQPTA
ncbi:hypothetical protein EV401DRAFT_2247385 [Pisolithus croceorrhizus]|nr:hypothetical protein EV401DRAFT_2247385 [Pisolithus croceorrhizus]